MDFLSKRIISSLSFIYINQMRLNIFWQLFGSFISGDLT